MVLVHIVLDSIVHFSNDKFNRPKIRWMLLKLRLILFFFRYFNYTLLNSYEYMPLSVLFCSQANIPGIAWGINVNYEMNAWCNWFGIFAPVKAGDPDSLFYFCIHASAHETIVHVHRTVSSFIKKSVNGLDRGVLIGPPQGYRYAWKCMSEGFLRD